MITSVKCYLLIGLFFIVLVNVAATPVNANKKLPPDFAGQDALLKEQDKDLLASYQELIEKYNLSERSMNKGKAKTSQASDCSMAAVNNSSKSKIKAISEVSEPTTMLLFGCSLIGLAAIGRKKLVKGKNENGAAT